MLTRAAVLAVVVVVLGSGCSTSSAEIETRSDGTCWQVRENRVLFVVNVEENQVRCNTNS